MVSNLTDTKYEVHLDYSVLGNLKPFKEEVLDELYKIHTLNGDMPLLFSGGMDSTFILRSLQELGINPSIVSFSFTKDNSDYDCELVKSRCKKFGTKPPEFFYMDEFKFAKHLRTLIDKKNIVYPVLHGFFIDYFLNAYTGVKFHTGLQVEFKLINDTIFLPSGPLFMKRNHPNRLYSFFSDRTFLSYFKHPTFVSNYKKPAPLLANNDVDQWYVRDLVYMDCYPEIEREIKNPFNHWRDYIKEPFHKVVLPYIQKKYPHLQKPPKCEFSAEFLVNL